MPRRNLIRTNEYPYHVTIRCNNKEWFDLPMETVWSICLEGLIHAKGKTGGEIQAFVLMSNHYHLLIWTPECNLDRFMYFLNRKISLDIRNLTKRINRIFGDRYHWSVIRDIRYHQAVLKYIYQNPRRAGIVNYCQDYKYSSLYALFKSIDLGFSLHEPYLEEFYSFLNWVNDMEVFPVEFSRAVRRPIFKYPRSSSSRRTI